MQIEGGGRGGWVWGRLDRERNGGGCEEQTGHAMSRKMKRDTDPIQQDTDIKCSLNHGHNN